MATASWKRLPRYDRALLAYRGYECRYGNSPHTNHTRMYIILLLILILLPCIRTGEISRRCSYGPPSRASSSARSSTSGAWTCCEETRQIARWSARGPERASAGRRGTGQRRGEATRGRVAQGGCRGPCPTLSTGRSQGAPAPSRLIRSTSLALRWRSRWEGVGGSCCVPGNLTFLLSFFVGKVPRVFSCWWAHGVYPRYSSLGVSAVYLGRVADCGRYALGGVLQTHDV